jgi:hypothetical protein
MRARAANEDTWNEKVIPPFWTQDHSLLFGYAGEIRRAGLMDENKFLTFNTVVRIGGLGG